MSLLMFDDGLPFPRSLFASGEQGIWLDPSDFSTLFQDAAGTTPVTALGQPVGLALDKRLGLVLGAEVITAAWTPNAATITESSGVVTFSGASQATDNITNGGTITSGRWYKATFTVSAYSSGGISFSVGTVSQGLFIAANGVVTQYFLATQTGAIQLRARGSTTNLVVSGVTVRELPGNHAYQTTAASRPTLQQDSNGLYYLSFDGTDDGMLTPSINFTGTDKMTVWAGAKSNSAASNAALFELSTAFGAGNPGSMGILWPRLPYAVNFGLAGTVAASRSTSAVADTGLRVISCAFDISKALTVDEITPRVNGAGPSLLTIDPGPAGTGNFGNYPLYIGRRGGTTMPFNGRIYQLIVRGAESNAGQIAAGEAWCNSKARAY